MGKSFFYGTDAEVNSGARSFAARITADPSAYGLTADQAAAFQVLSDAYSAALLRSADPYTLTSAAVQGKRTAKRAVRTAAASLAKLIDGNPNVTAAQKLQLGLSVRDPRSPMPPPGRPENFGVAIDGNGALILTWKCKHPPRATGTIYQVWRRVGGSSERVYLGATGKKRFTDSSLPAGATRLVYEVQAVRSRTIGPWATYNVSFGTHAGAPVTQVISGKAATKAAA